MKAHTSGPYVSFKRFGGTPQPQTKGSARLPSIVLSSKAKRRQKRSKKVHFKLKDLSIDFYAQLIKIGNS